MFKFRAPTLKAKIKAPIRPIINNIEAPSYKLASYLQRKHKDYVTLKNKYNSVNYIIFAENITKICLKSNYKMLTMDIKDLYVNIPIKETINITKQTLINNTINTQTVKEITQAPHTILLQNYFQHNGKHYKHNTGIAMGSPISSTTVEIFLQHMEQLLIKHALEQKTIIYYNRYVDIFIIMTKKKITPEQIMEHSNKLHEAIKFTLTTENKQQIAYLDLSLTNKHEYTQVDMYRKPTYTDVTINNTSCHPGEQKMSKFKNWLHRMHNIQLSETNRDKELNTIINIAESNGSANNK
jgi:hypothetical protein